jgi:uncharacterized protein involved in propanediol utilization
MPSEDGADSARLARTVLPPTPAPPPEPLGRVGRGEAHAHHGEILQGVFHSCDGTPEQGLVTLPCALFRTRASFRPLRSGPLQVEPRDRLRAKAAARLTLDVLGRTGWGGAARIEGDVPLSWGCGSSTMDVLAVIRAVADAFGVTLAPEWLARLAVAAETASDSLMYAPDRAVLFAQRRGAKLLDLGGPLPAVRVLGFNASPSGGGVETLGLPPIDYSWWELEAFGPLLGFLLRAVERDDPELLGRVATASTEINQRHRPKALVPRLLRLAKSAGAVGTQVAHSGTVAGLLFAPGGDADGRMERARDGLRRLGIRRTWEFTTRVDARPERAS